MRPIVSICHPKRQEVEGLLAALTDVILLKWQETAPKTVDFDELAYVWIEVDDLEWAEMNSGLAGFYPLDILNGTELHQRITSDLVRIFIHFDQAENILMATWPDRFLSTTNEE